MPLLDKLKIQLADPILYKGLPSIDVQVGIDPAMVQPVEEKVFSTQLIDFGAVGEKEVLQNVKYALLTTYYDVPLDREFGIDATFVDKPIPVAEIVLSQEIALKIGLYEPRAQFRDVSFEVNELEGKLDPTITIAIDLSIYLAPPPLEALPTKTSKPVETTIVYEETSRLPWIRGSVGEEGPPGAQGPKGEAATVDVGTTVTSEPGTDAEVDNVGTTSEAIFNFIIPRGDKGEIGEASIVPGPEGPQGDPGPIGPPGINAFNSIALDFTVPPIGETVDVDLIDASWVIVGQMLYVQDAGGPGQAAAFKVNAKSGNRLTLLNVEVGTGEGGGGGTTPIADTTTDGLMRRVSGLITDYVGGDNASHPLAYYYGTDTSNQVAYTVTVANNFALSPGVVVWVTPSYMNSGNATLNVNDSGAKPIVNKAGIALGGASIIANRMFGVVYDGTSWRVLTPVTLFYTGNNLDNPTIECAGYDSIVIVLSYSVTGAGITLSHVSPGVTVFMDIINSMSSNLSYYVNVTDANGAALGGTFYAPSGIGGVGLQQMDSTTIPGLGPTSRFIGIGTILDSNNFIFK